MYNLNEYCEGAKRTDFVMELWWYFWRKKYCQDKLLHKLAPPKKKQTKIL